METTSMEIKCLEINLKCPETIALYRMTMLQQNDSVGRRFNQTLCKCLNEWYGLIKSLSVSLETTSETKHICQVLRIYKVIAENDESLNEEISREGAHAYLSKIIEFDATYFEEESDQDALMELQDLTCEIAALSPSFPVKAAPFTLEELRDRLPLSFLILPANTDDQEAKREREREDQLTILINQVKIRQTAQKDVGFVIWPSAVALSRWLISNQNEVLNKSVLELGAGCGLVGLVAARMKSLSLGKENKKVSVSLTDFNDVVVKNMQQNILLNGLGNVAESASLDFYEQSIEADGWKDKDGRIREQVDLVLAADAVCQKEDAFALARSIFCSLSYGGKALIVSADSKHRFGVECIHDACTELGLSVTKVDVKELYDGRLITMNMEQTTGYVEGMSLGMYTIEKRRCDAGEEKTKKEARIVE